MSRKGSGESKGQAADAKSAKLSQKSASRYNEEGEGDAAEVASVVPGNNDQNAPEELKVEGEQEQPPLIDLNENQTNNGDQNEAIAPVENQADDAGKANNEIDQPE